MSSLMSLEKRMVLLAFGAEVYLTDPTKGIEGVLDKAKELESSTPNRHMLHQFTNSANRKAHYETGLEIWRDSEGNVDALVSGIGTGGTVTGVGKFLKKQNPNIEVYGVRPVRGDYIEGLLGSSVEIHLDEPQVLDESFLNDVIRVTRKEASDTAKLLALKEGLLVGISSGAAAAGAINLAKKQENAGKLIVVVFPSFGERYLSTELFHSIRHEAENMTVS